MAISADAILAVIASEAGVDPDKLNPDATLTSLDIGSLDVASAVFELEDRYGIELDPEQVKPDFTLAQFVAYIQAVETEAAARS